MNIESANGPRGGDWRLIAKLFLPSWNFFNDFAEVTRLEFCWVKGEAEKSGWQPLYPTISTRSWGRVFFNPVGNLELLEKSLIDRVATALREKGTISKSAFAQSEAGQMLLKIVRNRLEKAERQPAETAFRFRLVVSAPATPEETLFESEVHALGESNR